jgi:hypothetical protein
MPLLHIPCTQRDHGHAVEPSGQSWHGARLAGQSASIVHSTLGHVGNDPVQTPFTQSTLGHADDPSGQSSHGAPGWGQSSGPPHSVVPQLG